MDFNYSISQDLPVLVDFYVDKCDPCEMLTPILKNVQENLGHRIKTLQINLSNHPELAEKYEIHTTPTLLLFQNGKVKWRATSVLSNSEIITAVLDHINY